MPLQTLLSKSKKLKIGMLSLGCPKTLVDSELILGKFDSTRFDLAPSITECDVALINTCAFIGEAQKESVDHILRLIDLKREGAIRRIVVVGCLVQRFPAELEKELKEVDAFVGSGEYAKIQEVVERAVQGLGASEIGVPGYLSTSSEKRVALTASYSRYLKISEGCDHACAFCVIPSFRGKHRSRTIEDVLREARDLVESGAKEIILTGQDTTFFGYDLRGRYQLPELLKELNGLPGLEWIRLLYAYPSLVTDSLIEALASHEKVCHYLDMPLQHINDRILKSMQRGTQRNSIYRLLEKLRKKIPDLAVRTTFIVGYPGETDEEFDELLNFIDWAKFERMGIFTYSPEAGSPAARLTQQIPQKVKDKRLERAMLLQRNISTQNNQRCLGRTFRVLIEEKDSDSGMLLGRTYRDAPEVDGVVMIRGATESNPLKPGQFVLVRIIATQEYDLVGEVFPVS